MSNAPDEGLSHTLVDIPGLVQPPGKPPTRLPAPSDPPFRPGHRRSVVAGQAAGVRLKTLIVAGVLALSTGIPAALMAPAASAAATPVVYARGTGGWSHPSVRPSWILIGMGGAPGAHIRHWSTWDKGEPAPHATANGTLWVDNCIPNCAQGRESSHRLVVTLSVVRTHNGVRYYSRMTWYTPGYRLYGYRTSTAVLHYSAAGGAVPYWH